jgi:GDP-L-fucose synthase
MKYIITGGSGMVGRHLQEIMPDAIYLSSSDCDLTNYQSVLQMFNEHKPDGVIHLAAKVGGILQNMSYPADFFDQNILINSNTLIAAKESGVKRFLAVLSTCMYPDVVESYPMTEEDVHKGPPTNANFSYAYAKRCMAVQIDAYRKQHGLKYNYIIPCNLYGENDNFEDSSKSHFITALIKKIIDSEREGKKRILLFGSGKPMRQFMHSSDLANVIKKTILENITESFNVAPPNQNYSINQMAEMTLEALGKSDWTIDYDATKPDGQFRKDVSCDKMLQCLGNYNFITFKDGVTRVYNVLKDRYKE